jgi:hypothetical protein
VQRVMPPDFFGWKVVDLAVVAAAQSETEARRLADEEAQLPFEIAKGPLLRVILLRIAPEHHLLLMTMPHIVSDGWSLTVFCEELSALYGAFCAGRPSPLPELPIQFADYAVWKRKWLQGKVLEEQLGYWKQQLAGVPTKIELPSDHPRPPVQTLRGARYFLNFPTTLSEATAALGREEKTTLFMTLLAAFNTFLYTYTGQTDLLIGSPFANRTRIETQGLIGPLVNTLVLRTQLSGNPTFRDLLRRVREVVLGADAHQSYPFEKIVAVVRPPRDPSRNPLFQVNFRVMTGPLLPLKLPGVSSSHLISECVNSKFDLALELWVNSDKFGGFIEYSTDLFEETTIRRMSNDFALLLGDLLARPNTRLSDLAALKECQARLKEWQEAQRAKREQAKNKSLRDIRRKRS